ncbi:MAG TPA: bifunctional DNA-formamidopyrimidine glycosylase/DNA-(apurinic or apyrimidinic site) lyase [Zeimonas sp.]
MPELPEVEVVRRGLERRVLGRTVRTAHVREARLRWQVPAELACNVAGAVLRSVERRGKYLLLDFGRGTLLVHLGMSGNFRFLSGEAPPAPERHDHVDLEFEHGTLRYRDPRRFGAILWHPASEGPVLAHPLLASLGAEPLSDAFDGALLHRGMRSRTGAIKSVLLAGDVVVGVGNIYASESLFRAGIRPTTAARRIALPRCERLATAIRQTLGEAIERGGSTLRDFVSSDGAAGCYQTASLVYGRAGEPCRVCGTPVRTLRQQQRSTFWCPHCQR